MEQRDLHVHKYSVTVTSTQILMHSAMVPNPQVTSWSRIFNGHLIMSVVGGEGQGDMLPPWGYVTSLGICYPYFYRWKPCIICPN